VLEAALVRVLAALAPLARRLARLELWRLARWRL
jgi:hypothetical protein